jgi:hypothetical protein
MSADPFDLRAAGIQETAQIRDMRFGRGKADGGVALGLHGGHHEIFRGRHRELRQDDVLALELLRAHREHAVLVGFDIRAELAQREQMRVDRTVADRTAARLAHAHLFRARQNRAEKKNRETHPLHLFLVELGGVETGGVEHQFVLAFPFHLHAHALHDFKQAEQVGEARNILETHGPLEQQGGGNERSGRIFGARNIDAAA